MSAAQHPRLVLAELLRGARERYNLTRNDVAKRVGISIEKVSEYEAGDAVPHSDAWRRYGAAIDRSLIHRNREYQYAINSPQLAPNPLAGVVPAPPFKPAQVVASEVPMPMPSRDVTHLRARQAEIAASGYQFRRAEERAHRLNEARRIVAERPGISLTELREILQSKFQGVALTYDVLRGIREEAQAKVTRAIDRAVARTAREHAAETPAPAEPVAVAPAPHVPSQPSVDEQIGAAVDLILEAVPDLASLTVTIDAAGAAAVGYTRREVRVVETSGSLARPKKT